MKIRLTKSNLSGEVVAPRSKSYAHRALIASAFLSNNPVKIYGIEKSDDVLATIECLKNLGASIDFCDEYVIVTPPKSIFREAVLNVRSSASTLRFLLPIVSVLGVKTEFVLNDDLKNRPIAPLFDLLKSYGVPINGFKINGKFVGNKVEVDGSFTSQAISGFMFAFAVIGGGDIFVKSKIVSKGYIDMTVALLKDFGVEVNKTDYGYSVLKNKTSDVKKYYVEGDYSNSAFYFCVGALQGGITVKGLNPKSLQGDKVLLDVLKKVGAKVEFKGDEVTVEKGKCLSFDFDGEQTPDLIPILAVFASFLDGVSTIKNVERLKIKESDRIKSTLSLLSTAGIESSYNNGILRVVGGKPRAGDFYGFSDHRIAMAGSLLGLFCEGTSTIVGAESVSKSYPSFYNDLIKLGGSLDVDLEG